MLTLPNGHLLVETLEDLPEPRETEELYIDVETSGKNPYLDSKLAGIALVWDNNPQAYYIPVGHENGPNLNLTEVIEWLQKWFDLTKKWINHNIKFDAHFLACAGIKFDYDMPFEMVCSLTLSKIIQSDRLNHALKPLCREWLGMEMDEELRIKAFLEGVGKERKLKKAQYKGRYDWLPVDLCGEYACMDVYANRQLYRYLLENRPDPVIGIWETEIALTPVLFDMERRGMRVDKRKVKLDLKRDLTRLIEIHSEIHDITKQEFTDSSKHIFEILCAQRGLPVLAVNKDKNPSFDAKALETYALHPLVSSDPDLTKLIQLLLEYRKKSTHTQIYLIPYNTLQDENGYLHPHYNQVVRTGRMSGSHPNPQNLNKAAKGYIIPRPGFVFLSSDASQVEFRFIVHYTNDGRALVAYQENAATDFHQWVAELCGIPRKQAKNINFAIAFGAGKKKIATMLAQSKEVVDEVLAQMAEVGLSADDRYEFDRRCSFRAAQIFDEYHNQMSNIKKTAYQAQTNCRNRGYIVNLFGRRRHLPTKVAHIAFNAVIQSVAMDFIKTKMIKLSPRYNKHLRDLDVHLLINVHDELVYEIPEKNNTPELRAYLLSELETKPEGLRNAVGEPVELSTPLLWDMGVSGSTWADAAGDEAKEALQGELEAIRNPYKETACI